MCIRANADRRAGFTLLEVMTATLVIALLTMAIYRFISTTLTALSVTTAVTEERQEIESLTKMLQTQLNELTPRGGSVLLGKAVKLRDLSCDEMTWTCRSGEGVMTGAAPGQYKVTLTVQTAEDKSGLELGLRRELATAEAKSDIDFFTRGGGSGSRYNWLPLIRPIAALEIRYWDSRLNAQIQQWNDANNRPSFVHVKIWKNVDDVPYDVILNVPSANLQQQ